MIVTTMNDIPGYEVDEVFGEVFGLTVRSRNIGSQIGAPVTSILGGELKGIDGQPRAGHAADDRGGRDEGGERGDRHALRHLGDGGQLDRDLRVRDRGARAKALTGL
jgi:hypothetical protein